MRKQCKKVNAMGSGGLTISTRKNFGRAGQKIRVIVIDDDEDLLETFVDTLELKGIEVLGTGNDGEQAFQLYKKFLPDVAIIDMDMPNYDGGYAATKIRSKYPHAKIVVLTAYRNYKFDKDDVNAIFYKPYDVNSIVKVLEELVSR